ncbi:MAG: phosphatase domain-containing protein [Ferruginibacter sp.]
MNDNKTGVLTKLSFFKRIKRWFFSVLRLSNSPAIKLYRGYGNGKECHIFGHVLSFGPLPRKKYRNIFLINTLAVLRLFMVRPVANATVQLQWEGKLMHTLTEADGFFKFEWNPVTALDPGSYEIEAWYMINGQKMATAGTHLIIPFTNQFAFISDIDDTFLISHSSNLRKRLFVLLTENARSRKPFEGVVNHYNLLSCAGAAEKTSNTFFYVSSSEWNLYDYIREFSALNKLPEGVYLLNQIKKFTQVFKTGQNNHKTKFMRIVRILEAFPQQVFILLGDDTQEDPNIYASIVEHFPKQIFCVYIRMVGQLPKDAVQLKLTTIEKAGVKYCYFKHSAEAVIHSKMIGLIAST